MTPHIHRGRYGVTETGTYRPQERGGWWRDDIYTSNDGTRYAGQSIFCTGRTDVSAPARDRYGDDPGNIEYTSDCACCYLHFGHTVDYHNESVKKTRDERAAWAEKQRQEAEA